MLRARRQRALVAGWFSFEQAAAGAGDLLAKDLVCEWLDLGGFPYDVALASPFAGGVDYASVDPRNYTHVIFVCGPFYKSNLLKRFEGCHRIGINLTMIEPLRSWNPFNLLLERDSSEFARPDITFVSHRPKVPVVGIILGGTNENPNPPSSHDLVMAVFNELIASTEMSVVPIDTRLDGKNRAGLRTPAEVESLIARMDVVLTTRLHGMVLALKNGIPAVAVDPVCGGHKIRRQAEAVRWPVILSADGLDIESVRRAFEYCLTSAARTRAAQCAQTAVKEIEELGQMFISAMQSSHTASKEWGDGRRCGSWLTTQPPQKSPHSLSRGPAGLWSRMKDAFHRTGHLSWRT